jgi:hypothetical protein
MHFFKQIIIFLIIKILVQAKEILYWKEVLTAKEEIRIFYVLIRMKRNASFFQQETLLFSDIFYSNFDCICDCNFCYGYIL